MLIPENLPRFEKVCSTGTKNCFSFDISISCSQQSKTIKNPEINNHLSFDGIIQENTDISDIYQAVTTTKKTMKFGVLHLVFIHRLM